MKPVALLAFAAACAPSLHAIEEHNRGADHDADARIAAAGPAFQPASAQLAISNQPLPAADAGLEPGEHLYSDGGRLVFASDACERPAPCGHGCEVPVRYSFHRAGDGHVIVLRERVHEHVVDTKHDAGCPVGCVGGNPPGGFVAGGPPMISGLALGIDHLDQLELRTITRDHWVVARVCTNTTPVP